MKSQREEETAVAGVEPRRGKLCLLGLVHSKDTLPTVGKLVLLELLCINNSKDNVEVDMQVYIPVIIGILFYHGLSI